MQVHTKVEQRFSTQRASEWKAKEQEADKNSMIPIGSTVFTWKHLAVDSLTKTSNPLKAGRKSGHTMKKKITIRLLA